ncbi:MAG: hypothetical protein ACK54X_14500 [Burkholderiales bacterium]
MDADRFELFPAHRIGDDRELAGLLARLGARTSVDPGPAFDGVGHYAAHDVPVDRPMRLHARMELTGAPGYLQAVRFALGPLDAGPETAGWLPSLDVAPAQVDGWVSSRRCGARTRGEGRRLGYQGWWQHGPGVGRGADLSSRVLVHARHERGSLLRIAARTDLETPVESHKQTFAIVVESDD